MTSPDGEDPAGDAAGEPADRTLLTDRDEVQFRQVHPHFFDGEPTAGAFRPGSNDDGELSVAREALTTAVGAYERHTNRGRQSMGTWGVTVGEAKAAALDTFADPQPDDEAHSFIDFDGLGKGPVKAKSKLLRHHAVSRGCLYRPSIGE